MSKPLFCRHRWQILRQGLYPPMVSAAICHFYLYFFMSRLQTSEFN